MAVTNIGRVAVVTGASRGIGAATALELARQGASVVLVARSTDERPHRSAAGTLDAIERVVREVGAPVLALRADVADEADVAAVHDAVLSTFGRCDVLVNNAATSFVGPFLELSVKRWDVLMGVNVRGPMLLAQAFLPGMVAAGSGTIVNITSTGGSGAEHPDLRGKLLAYNVSKAALNRFTTGLATEVEGSGVTVNAVEVQAVTSATRASLPGTDFSHLERPEAAAQVVAWVARQSGVSGQVFNQEDLLVTLRSRGEVPPRL